MEHRLKTWKPFYAQIVMGRKTFEVRKNDRDFQVGDSLLLEEWDSKINDYTGGSLLCRVEYLMNSDTPFSGGIERGYVVLGIRYLNIVTESKSTLDFLIEKL